MTKKKICFIFGHFQPDDGVCRSVVAMANILNREKNVQVDLIPLYRFKKKTLSLLDSGVNVLPIFRTYFKGLSRLLSCCPNILLYKLIIRKKYDIEIAFQYDIPTKIISASTNRTAQHLVWMHGYDYGLTNLQYYIKYDKLITVSKFNAERFFRESNQVMKVDYCYNPIDETNIIEQGREDVDILNDNLLKFIVVGRLSPEKGYVRLVNICKRLHGEGFKFHLYIVGDGPMRNEVKKQTMGDSYITMLGSQINPYKYISKCDMMICSSFSEGYSTVCVEATMLGVPILSTSVSGADEIVFDAGAGMVVGMTDDDLYHGIKHVLSTPNIIAEWKCLVDKNKYKFFQMNRAKKLYTILNLD